jgi:hypothetical protein
LIARTYVARRVHRFSCGTASDALAMLAACPLHANRFQISAAQGNGALCQSRPNAPQQKASLFDHLVGAAQQG